MNTKKLARFTVILVFTSLFNLPSWAQTQQLQKSKIIFTKFSVSTGKKRISFDWTTDGNVATNYFELQKSTDGTNFKTIAFVLGPDPKQPTCDCYGCYEKYVHKTAKHSYYRLKHVDTDGVEQLSETKLLAKL